MAVPILCCVLVFPAANSVKILEQDTRLIDDWFTCSHGPFSRHFCACSVQRSWLTPVELFQPWYSQAVAQFIVRHHSKQRPNQPLSIVEIGGGQGTLAKGILVCELPSMLLCALQCVG